MTAPVTRLEATFLDAPKPWGVSNDRDWKSTNGGDSRAMPGDAWDVEGFSNGLGLRRNTIQPIGRFWRKAAAHGHVHSCDGFNRYSRRLLVFPPGFADVAERPVVHNWKFATRVGWLNGH
jgi:hypothetical protein